MANETLNVILNLVTGNYKREAGQAATATSRIGGAAQSVTSNLQRMIGPAAIAGAIAGFGKMAVAAGENADRLFDLQAQTGLSTDALQEWEFTAKVAGASTEVFSDAVKAVIKNLNGTEGATGAAAKAYDTLGVSVFDSSGKMRDAGSITEEVFDKLAGMENITARNALAQDIFGKKWEETVSILDLGSEALGRLRDEGKKGVVSAEALRNADKFRETWQRFLATVGPKLNEVLGKIAPALTTVAEAALDAVEAAEPLIDLLGVIAEKFTDANAAVEEGRDSPSIWANAWATASDVGSGAIFGMLGILSKLFDEENVVKDNTADVTQGIHDSWETLAGQFVPITGEIITMLDRQKTAHRNVAKAADTQRTAMINLANAQADLLDPVSNVIRLTGELETAQKDLADAQAAGDTPADELALAAIAVEQAFLRLQSAGAALTPDQIQAFAQVLMSQLGMSESQALDTLAALNLLDGWTGSATFTLEMEEVVNAGGVRGGSPGGGLPFSGFGFATGGVVPGPRGSPQLILAHAGETILPTHKPMSKRMETFWERVARFREIMRQKEADARASGTFRGRAPGTLPGNMNYGAAVWNATFNPNGTWREVHDSWQNLPRFDNGGIVGGGSMSPIQMPSVSMANWNVGGSRSVTFNLPVAEGPVKPLDLQYLALLANHMTLLD